MIRNAGAHVGIKAERLAHGDVKTLVATALRRGDWSVQKNFGAAQRVPRAGLDSGRVSGEIDLFADIDRFDFEGRSRAFENLECGGHDLRPNAVAVCDSNRNSLRHSGRKPLYNLNEFLMQRLVDWDWR